MILSNQDHGRTVEVEAQSVGTVRLDENPSTGYRWSVETNEGLEMVDDSFEKAGDAMGQEAFEYYSFAHRRRVLTGLALENGVIGREKVQ